MKSQLFILLCLLFFGTWPCSLNAQRLDRKKDPVQKTLPKASMNTVRTAALHSAIIPGWGQAYNKKYWKIPLVYAALGTTGYLFIRNLNQYKDSKNAYILATDNDPTNDFRIKEPYYTVRTQPERIRDFRNAVRQNMDYSILWFVIFWGLNVADAAVDAHLKTFDVSDNLSLQLKAGYSNMAQTAGVSIVLGIK